MILTLMALLKSPVSKAQCRLTSEKLTETKRDRLGGTHTLFPSLGRWRLKEQELKVMLDFVASLKLTWAMTISKQKFKEKVSCFQYSRQC